MAFIACPGCQKAASAALEQCSDCGRSVASQTGTQLLEFVSAVRGRMNRAKLICWMASITSVLVLIAAHVNPSPMMAVTLVVTTFAAAFNYRWYSRLKKGLQLIEGIQKTPSLPA